MSHASLLDILKRRFEAAVAQAAGAKPGEIDPQVRAAQDARFGDYQCNVAMSLAKTLRAKPREVAERIVAAADLRDLADALEVAGPGFINIRLKTEALERHLGEIEAPPASDGEPRGVGAAAIDATGGGASGGAADGEIDRFGIPVTATPKRVVVDYSSPNIAKEMHVGHLRSTIIGDVFARVLMFEGNEVMRQNHVGDWGTGIGMVILGLWYIRSRLQRGESAEQVRQRREYLAAHVKAPVEQRRAALEAICGEWSEDLRRPELDAYAGLSIGLSELELGYVFVQALTSFAEGTGVIVTDEKGVSTPLVDIPRLTTKRLQARKDYEIKEWEEARRISLDYCQRIYDRLGVLLTREDVVAESFYDFEKDLLPGVVAELTRKFAPENRPAQGAWAEMKVDKGALCIFAYDEKGEPRFKTQEGEPLPIIIQKSDGAYLYMTTDLAAIPYRTRDLRFPDGTAGAERVIYVTDARQKQRFEMLFEAGRLAGWLREGTSLEHVTFGSVLGEDRKPLKTRSGQNIKLGELLDEAERRAKEVLEARGESDDLRRTVEAFVEDGERLLKAANGPIELLDKTGKGADSLDVVELVMKFEDLFESTIPDSDATRINTIANMVEFAKKQLENLGALKEQVNRRIARNVGIASVKYADLARDRNSDYVFSWEKMLAMQGNTAPYMMYAYARIRSIYRKAAEQFGSPDVYAAGVPVRLREPAERALGLRLARLAEAIGSVATELMPHVLCGYLYDLASEFMRFYETCPVVQAPDEATRLSRMRLADLTARALKLGLGLLGIEAIERM